MGKIPTEYWKEQKSHFSLYTQELALFLKGDGKENWKNPQILLFKMALTPYNAEQPLKDTGLQEMKFKKIKAYKKSDQKTPTDKRFLVILDIKPFMSQVKGEHSVGREFQSPAVRRKNLLTQTSL